MQVFFYICEYLEVTPSEFFDEGNGDPTEFREIIKDLTALDPENIKSVKSIIKGLKK